MKRFFLYAIVIAALALAGCGGGGGGTAMMPTEPTEPTEPTTPVDPGPTPPPMELVMGIVTANDDDYNATKPAPYDHMDRPTKTTVTTDDLTVGVKDDGTFGDVTIGTNKLTMSEDMTPPSVGRFATGGVFTRTSMDVTDTVYVYETKAAPGPQGWDLFAADLLTGAAVTGATNPDDTATQQLFTPLEFAADVSLIAKRFAADMFPSNAVQMNTYHTIAEYNAIENPGVTDIRGQKFAGMFAGIPGEYSCTGTCTAQTNSQGYVATLAGTWTFTPNNLALGVQGHMVQGVIEDTDYLTFGYWVKKDDDEGDVTISVGTFATGMRAFDVTATALEGTAEYDGKAGGKFVRKTLAPDGTATIVDGGVFTADASLKANFGGDAVAVNVQNSITGTINNFRDGDGDMISPSWSVTLGKADYATAGGATTFSGTTSAGGPAGTWGGAFFGAPATAATDRPEAVAGEFDAHFADGHALGAFGAEVKK